MRGFTGYLFMLYVVAAATSISLGQCGFGSAEVREPVVENCAAGVLILKQKKPRTGAGLLERVTTPY